MRTDTRKFRLALTTLTLVALLLAVFGVVPAWTGGPWYVDANTGDDINDCLSTATACETIGAAIGKASDGDTINVAEGTYPEKIEIPGSKSLTIQATGTAQNTIMEWTGMLGGYEGIVTILSNNTTFRGFTVKGVRDMVTTTFVIYVGGLDCTIADNIVKDSNTIAGVGIEVVYSGRCNITGNTVTDNVYGIELKTDQNTLTDNNDVSGNDLCGIRLEEANDNSITGNTIANNGGEGGGQGIAIMKIGLGDPSTGNTINHNKIYGNTTNGVYKNHTPPVDATNNWWGDKTGPSGEGAGSGDAVSTNVDYSPWWANESGTATGTELTTTDHTAVQAAITGASSGDVIVLAVGTHTGGFTVDTNGITILGHDGTVIHGGSPAYTITADGVTIDNQDIDGQGTHPDDSGVVVVAGVSNLWIRNCEIHHWGHDGINFEGAITGLKIVDNYIHHNGDDALDFSSAPGGTVHIYGNAFRSNGGYGIRLASGAVTAEYNEWGAQNGPDDDAGVINGSGDKISTGVDADPWVFGKVYADVVPDPALVRETENIDVDIKTDAWNLYGAQFSLTFDPAKLQVVGTTDSGTGYFKGSLACDTSYDNVAGTLSFYCSRQAGDGAYSGTGGKLLTITFKAQEITGVSTTDDIEFTDTSVKLNAIGGVNIFVDSVTDDSLTILGTTTVSGVVDLQGRDDDGDAVVDPQAGTNYGWDPAAYTTGPWGDYSFAHMTDDEYTFTIEIERYLDASKTVNVQGDNLDLGTAILLGGDVVKDADKKIDMSDISSICGVYDPFKPVNPVTTVQDVNADGLVDISDLVLAAGNYDVSEPTTW